MFRLSLVQNASSWCHIYIPWLETAFGWKRPCAYPKAPCVGARARSSSYVNISRTEQKEEGVVRSSDAESQEHWGKLVNGEEEKLEHLKQHITL